jgi:general secretion pathway protein G
MVIFNRRFRGFTLIELLVVLAILALLLTIAAPRYLNGVDKAKEAALLSDLRNMREAIDQYYGDYERYPNNLDELVQKDYLRRIPADPLTNSTDTWLIVPPRGEVAGEIFDIRSGAEGVGENGVPYAEW